MWYASIHIFNKLNNNLINNVRLDNENNNCFVSYKNFKNCFFIFFYEKRKIINLFVLKMNKFIKSNMF